MSDEGRQLQSGNVKGNQGWPFRLLRPSKVPEGSTDCKKRDAAERRFGTPGVDAMTDCEQNDGGDESQTVYVRISDKAEISLQSEDIEADWERIKRTVDAYLEARKDEQ